MCLNRKGKLGCRGGNFRLATQPLMGRARDELAEGLRSMPMGRHVVFYVPLSDGIDIVRVLHSARDIDALFSESNQ